MQANTRRISKWVKAGKSLSGLLLGLSAGCTYQESSVQHAAAGAAANPMTNEVRLVEDEVIMGELEPAFETYTVQAGDTLYKIASQFKTTVSVLKELNSLDDKRANQLHVGQCLFVPMEETDDNLRNESDEWALGGDI